MSISGGFVRRFTITAIAIGALVATPITSATAAQAAPAGGPTATGFGGAVSTVDATATRAGLEVLRNGGNAVDAALAAVATLGVT
jgi:gamma-glutamyltranspeptidase/glutathione hydrolase